MSTVRYTCGPDCVCKRALHMASSRQAVFGDALGMKGHGLDGRLQYAALPLVCRVPVLNWTI